MPYANCVTAFGNILNDFDFCYIYQLNIFNHLTKMNPMDDLRNEYIQIIKKCVSEYLISGNFFNSFYKSHGNAFFFLFKKNLRVTNIQYPELTSLIKMFSKSKIEENFSNKIQFFTINQFNNAIKEIISSFSLDIDKNKPEEREKLINHFAETYSDLLKNIIVIDYFYTSCSVFVPPMIQLDLENICAMSGYIHSCGNLIHIRNLVKFDTEEFFNKLDHYLENTKIEDKKKTFFVIYAHEDFSIYDFEYKDELAFGLEDVKIHEEKFFMGKKAIVHFISELEKRKELYVPKRGNYRSHHELIFGNNNIRKNRSIWLIIDKSVNESHFMYPGDSSYYVCYEQQYVNLNQLHLFDENKIGWKSSTTLPHTLCGAMLNIGLADMHQNTTIEVCDPFSGSGTAFLESLKYKKINFTGRELDALCEDILKFNIDFFKATYNNIDEKIETEIKYLLDKSKFNLDTANTGLAEKKKFSSLIKEILLFFPKENNGEFFFPANTIKKILGLNLRKKILFYFLLRLKLNYKNTFIRIKADINESEEEMYKLLIKDVNKFRLQLIKYKHLIAEYQDNQLVYESNKLYSISAWSSTYSRATSIDKKVFRISEKSLMSKHAIGADGNILNIPENQYDLIITDPPYGFNTDDSTMELSSFYKEFIAKLIKALKNNGQLVMALPDRSHSGRISPYFTHKEIVVQNILNICNENGFALYSQANTVPNNILFRPPFYWESEKALRRSIIHFKIKRP